MTPVSPLRIISAGNLNELRFQLVTDVAGKGQVRTLLPYITFLPNVKKIIT